jgi:flavodoxin
MAIEVGEWAAGIWNGTNGATINILRDGSAILDAGLPKKYIVAGYSLADKTVTVVGDVTADFSGTVHIPYFNTAISATSDKNEFLGIHAISEETTSLFGVANAAEPLFQGSIIDVGTSGVPVVLSQSKIEEGIAAMVEKGLMEEEVCVYVNPKQWDDLLSEQDAKRVIDSSYSSSKHQSGAREIEFFGQNGTIKIKASTFVKQGYSYIICEKDLKRLGSTEVTFNRPDGEKVYKLLEGKHGIEMRCMTDQALFTSRPSSICQLRYIKAE